MLPRFHPTMPEDYILRMIREIGMMVAAIVAKVQKGEVEEAGQDLTELCLRTTGLPIDAVKNLSPDALAAQLESAGALRWPRSVMLAELLLQDAEIQEARGKPQAAWPDYVHAFCLLCDVFDFLTQEEQEVYRPKMERLAKMVERLPENPYTTERVREGRWRSAEGRSSA